MKGTKRACIHSASTIDEESRQILTQDPLPGHPPFPLSPTTNGKDPLVKFP
jgi:hypothetical protein